MNKKEATINQTLDQLSSVQVVSNSDHGKSMTSFENDNFHVNEVSKEYI